MSAVRILGEVSSQWLIFNVVKKMVAGESSNETTSSDCRLKNHIRSMVDKMGEKCVDAHCVEGLGSKTRNALKKYGEYLVRITERINEREDNRIREAYNSSKKEGEED